MTGLCKYKDFFGKPNTGAHRYRVLNIAIIDVIFTIIAAYLISLFVKYNFYYILTALFVAGIIANRLFCVRTTIDKLLFP